MQTDYPSPLSFRFIFVSGKLCFHFLYRFRLVYPLGSGQGRQSPATPSQYKFDFISNSNGTGCAEGQSSEPESYEILQNYGK